MFIRFIIVAVPSRLERTSPNPSVQRSRASIVNSATPTFNLSPLQRRNDAEASAIWQSSGHCMQSGTVSGMSGRGPAQVCPTFKQGSCIDKAQLGGQFLTLQVFVREICLNLTDFDSNIPSRESHVFTCLAESKPLNSSTVPFHVSSLCQ